MLVRKAPRAQFCRIAGINSGNKRPLADNPASIIISIMNARQKPAAGTRPIWAIASPGREWIQGRNR